MHTEDDFQKVLAEELGLEADQEKHPTLKLVEETFFGQHYQQKTEIQKKTIDPIFLGRNALIISATASGKTEAAIVPVIAQIISERRKFICAYLAPTKALLNDLIRRLSPYLEHLMVPFAIRHGDRKIMPKVFNILFTTPESFDVLLGRDEEFLHQIRFIIIDEVHQIYNSPRGIQMLLLLERLKKKTSNFFQRIALSATVSQPQDLAKWLQGTDSVVEIFCADEHRTMKPKLFWVSSACSIIEIVRATSFKKILVFANTRRRCEDTFLSLKACDPYKVYVHYSSLEKEDREFVETGFKQSEFAICVATSTLEIGVDIGSVELVIFADPPESVGSFLQRSGRGGRRSESIDIFMLSGSVKNSLHFGALVSLANQNKIENIPPGKFYSVVVQQIFSYIAGKQNHRLIEEEIFKLCRCFNWVTEADITAILDNLLKKGYLSYDQNWKSYQMESKLAIKYNRGVIYTNIVSGNPGIEVFLDNRKLATIPLPQTTQVGDIFLFAGRFWKIIRITETGLFVIATKPISDPILPRWGGSGLSISSSLVGEMRNILLNNLSMLKMIAENDMKKKLANVAKSITEGVTKNNIIQEEHDKRLIYYTFGGTFLNFILKTIFNKIYPNSGLRINSNELALISNCKLDFGSIPNDTDLVYQVVRKNWRLFRPLIPVSENFHLLPSYLQRDEILSQLIDDQILAKVVSYSSKKMVKAKLGLITT